MPHTVDSRFVLPSGDLHQQGVYIIHFDEPLKGRARHYLGWSTDVGKRLARHKAGNGSRLMQVIKAAGIGWTLTGWWPGATYADEQQLKKQHNHERFCPFCGRKEEKHG